MVLTKAVRVLSQYLLEQGYPNEALLYGKRVAPDGEGHLKLIVKQHYVTLPPNTSL